MTRTFVKAGAANVCNGFAPKPDAVLLGAARRAVRAGDTDRLEAVDEPGESMAATALPDLADLTICAISVCPGEKIPRKGGPGITRSDPAVVNRGDPAPHTGARLDATDEDIAAERDEPGCFRTGQRPSALRRRLTRRCNGLR